MARYNTFKYGSGTKYGESARQQTLTASLSVDWDNDTVLEGSESNYALAAEITRGRRHLLTSAGNEFEEVRVGEATS
jgi:phage gpG-like protein